MSIFDKLINSQPLTPEETASLPTVPYKGNNPKYQNKQYTPQGLLVAAEDNYNKYKQEQDEIERQKTRDSIPGMLGLDALASVVKAPIQDFYYTFGGGTDTEKERFNKTLTRLNGNGFKENISDEDVLALELEKQRYMQNYVTNQTTDWEAYKKRREE
jgi:hypothetical protein